MNVEEVLVSKIATTGKIEDVLAQGIRGDHFADESCRDLFLWMNNHTRRFKTPPSIEAVETKIKETPELRGFEIIHSDDALDYIVERFITNVKRRLGDDMLVELAEALNDANRARDIDLEFLEASRKLATIVPSTRVSRFSDMERRIDEYEKRQQEDKPTGVPFGFPTLDEWTGGIQPHEFVTVSGFSGLGKSTLLMVLAFNAWSEGYTPLYISLEMEAGAILRKFDAMAASLDYTKLKHLGLPKDQLANWREKAQEIRDRVNDIPVIDSIRHCTPDHIFAETVRHKPDIVFVDYLSLMRSSHPSGRGVGMWQIVTEITQDMKQNARTLKIPIVAAAQTNRSGAKDGAELDNIGSSISIVQDSDMVIGLFADDDMKARKEMEIRLRKNRDGRLGEFAAVWDHEKMLFRQKTPKDTFGRAGRKAKEQDERDEPVEKPEAAQEAPEQPTPRKRPRPQLPSQEKEEAAPAPRKRPGRG